MKKQKITLLLVALLAMTLVLCSCFLCKHSFSEGKCTICGTADPNYNPTCSHTYVNGVCTLCQSPCNHTFEGESCTVCGSPCTHDYKNGACIYCDKPCVHNYEEGVCTICDKECRHNYVQHICTICDMREPINDMGMSLYDEIIDSYKALITYKHANEELPERPDPPTYYTDAIYEAGAAYSPVAQVGYSFKDIDKDGFVELFLVGYDCRLFAMFTIKDETPMLVRVFGNGMGYMAPDGTIFFNTRTVEESYLSEKYITRFDGRNLVGIRYGWLDADADLGTGSDVTYHYVDENGVKSTITESEHRSINEPYSYYWSYATRLTRLTGLRYYPAMSLANTTSLTADFSSYDAIIKTFGLIHTQVAGGRCQRTDWSGGDYDLGMKFESTEDFELYNMLIAASVLSQNSKTSVFGYALKDLNGDGTEELILLERLYYVLAVFTEVDGAPKLLDVYNDRRVACIDSEGYIHVKEHIIPGNEADSEYFVYKIENGELVATVAIGVKHNSSGVANKWYKTENGIQVEITKDEYDSLYASYISDIGSSAFHVYTRQNSGLLFVEATGE